MTKNRPGIVLMLLLLAVVAASAQPAAPGTAATVAPAEGFVPVAIWECSASAC